MTENIVTTNGAEKTENIVVLPSYDISKFKLDRILNNNIVRKSIALLGTFPDKSAEDLAIILFEKQAFTTNDVQTYDKSKDDLKLLDKHQPSLFNNDLHVETEFINNIYGSFKCVPSADLNGLKATVVYPATEKHIEKYSVAQKYLINETPTLYENLTLPYLQSCQFSLDWVYNILEHKQETERIAYEDTDAVNGFVLLPDLKWDGNIETLYLLAIVQQRDIKSLRDLTAEHLPLLRNIREKAAKAIEAKYDIVSSQLRMYLHYQPSFYHLHVHINPIRNDAPGIWCEKSHLLDTVIDNIELMSNYYQRATLPFVVFDSSKLLDKFEQEFKVRKCLKADESFFNDNGSNSNDQ